MRQACMTAFADDFYIKFIGRGSFRAKFISNHAARVVVEQVLSENPLRFFKKPKFFHLFQNQFRPARGWTFLRRLKKQQHVCFKFLSVPLKQLCGAKEHRCMSVMSAGMHFIFIQRFIRYVVFFLKAQRVHIRSQSNHALPVLTRYHAKYAKLCIQNFNLIV